MKTDFKCPHCSNLLNAGPNIVFTSRNRKGKEGIIMLHPELGNYSVNRHPDFDVPNDEMLEFYCPYCKEQLKSEKNPYLAWIRMSDETGLEYDIHFSRIAGQHATYKITGKNVETFGEDAGEYLDDLK
ncbi:MAG: hypothetical protein IPH20_03555 [Bacteroidales bacterium]|nr:hypothetical protein [Bacteroidales bacterium]